MMTCACYLRVSTEDQARKATPIPSQLTEIREWAKANGATILEDWIIADEGISGSTDNRPGFQKLIKATENNSPFNAILVYDRDRFFRNFEEEIYYEVVLRKRGVDLISVTENQDPQLVKYIKMIVAEETRKQGIKHTIRGMKEKARRGLWNGGLPAYGYKKAGDSIIPDRKEAKTVRNIFEWYLKGNGYFAIADRLNKNKVPSPGQTGKHGGRPTAKFGWAKSTIRWILRNRVYVGDLVWNKRKKTGEQNLENEWIIKEKSFKGVIDPKTFNRVQGMIKRRSHKKGVVRGRKPTKKYLLSGVMFCGNCGHHYIGYSYGKGDKHYYFCGGYKTKGRYFCEWFPIDAEWIENRVFGEIYNRLNEPDLLDKTINDFNQELIKSKGMVSEKLRTLKQRTTRIDGKLSKMLNLIKDAPKVPQTLLDEMLTLEAEKEELEIERNALSLLPDEEKVSQKQIASMLLDLRGLIDRNATPEEKREFIKSFIPRIEIYPHDKAVTQLTLQPVQAFFQLGMAVPGFEPGSHG